MGKFNHAARLLSDILVHLSQERQRSLFRKEFTQSVYDRFFRLRNLLELEERTETVESESCGAVYLNSLHGLILDGFCLQFNTNSH
jgi:hypothetical protein